ncbi:MAG: AmmeMemoRadiSam system protein A [Victivallaceae bacterium]|nr:AmmeMemoRadiSam system protein A [Victivallaceae bacterium]
MTENRFDAGQRRAVLEYVRSVIEHRLAGIPAPARPDMAELRGLGSCFVTLNDASGELRGCIGSIEAVEPLGDSLERNALNAALCDPRFPPVEPDELPELHIEVSVLTPLRLIASPAEFVVGRHGILFELGRSHAVFLPQVAVEQGWDAETTLNFLANKAGLPKEAWRHPQARFSVFEAEVFGEAEK